MFIYVMLYVNNRVHWRGENDVAGYHVLILLDVKRSATVRVPRVVPRARGGGILSHPRGRNGTVSLTKWRYCA